MRRRAVKGDSDIVSTALTLSVVVAIGLGMLGLLSSYSSIGRQEAVQSLNKDQLVLRSALGADYVYFPDWRLPEESGYGVARVRNVGDERITIFRIIVYRNGSLVYDSGIDPSNYVTINVGQAAETYFRCPGCRGGDSILVTAHYLPTALIDPDSPRSIEPLIRTELFKVAAFDASVPRAGFGEVCPVTDEWIFVELVDPRETVLLEDGRLVFMVVDEVKLRLLLASDRVLDTSIRVNVLDEYGNSASGTIPVAGELPVEIRVPVTGEPLRYPLTVTIESEEYTVLPRIWRFNVQGDILAPDYAKINLDSLNRLATSFLVSAYATDQASVQVVLRLQDCFGSYAAQGKVYLDFDPRGEMYQVSQGSYHLNPLISLQNIYEVSIDYVDMTIIDVVWLTLTATQTTNLTATMTITTTTTIPSTTVTSTSTSTTTTTRTVYTSTTTTTLTSTRTVTSTLSTTTTRTVTTRTVTVTVITTTATVTRTSTLTSYTTTTTVRVTATATQTSTRYSPTITITETRTTTTYTPTLTITATSTRTSTTRTTVTTTTTTTTTMSRLGGDSAVPVLPVVSGIINTGYEPLLLLGGALAASVALSPLLWRVTRRLEVRGS